MVPCVEVVSLEGSAISLSHPSMLPPGVRSLPGWGSCDDASSDSSSPTSGGFVGAEGIVTPDCGISVAFVDKSQGSVDKLSRSSTGLTYC